MNMTFKYRYTPICEVILIQARLLFFFYIDEAESADDVTSGSEDLPELPDFFSHKHFMLYGEIESTTRRLLIRYITAYNG